MRCQKAQELGDPRARAKFHCLNTPLGRHSTAWHILQPSQAVPTLCWKLVSQHVGQREAAGRLFELAMPLRSLSLVPCNKLHAFPTPGAEKLTWRPNTWAEDGQLWNGKEYWKWIGLGRHDLATRLAHVSIASTLPESPEVGSGQGIFTDTAGCYIMRSNESMNMNHFRILGCFCWTCACIIMYCGLPFLLNLAFTTATL